MKNLIEGFVYVLADNIDTDQIIPAKHLIYDISNPKEKKMYGRYSFSGVPEDKSGLPHGHIHFVKEGKFKSDFTIVVAGENFGCGSSREHAPFSMREAGIEAVIAQSYSRLFFRNSIDGAFFPPFQCNNKQLVQEICTGDRLLIDVMKKTVKNMTQQKEYTILPLGDVLDIIKAGGIFKYAKKEHLF